MENWPDRWIIAISNSANSGNELYQFNGTKEEIKEELMKYITQDKNRDIELYNDGTKRKEDLYENFKNIEGWNDFEDYHMEYTAKKLRDIFSERPNC